ncbi:MAG: hypothetical protein ABSF83_02390 [Nitrososphaerales archaeon]|jgi:hypothetical protein
MNQGPGALMIVGLVVASVLLGVGVGLTASQNAVFGSSSTVTETTTVSGQNASAPYVLTLIITTGNYFNSTTGDQPAYYVLGPGGLQSAANITLPANRLVELVISNYDEGNASLASPQYASVNGTVDGSELVYNNTAINSTEGPNGITLRGSQTVSSLPLSEISHTFTVPMLNLNLPMASESTIVAYFRTGSAGTFLWLCESACGSGADGTAGAMSTPGWMTGTLTVR